MEYLTEQEVIALNFYAIEKYSPNEQAGVKSPELLNSAVNRPEQSIFGEDAYKGVFEKTSALFESLAKNHPFYNANKRTATLALLQSLYFNGFELEMSEKELSNFVVDVVNHQYDFGEIVKVITSHSVKI